MSGEPVYHLAGEPEDFIQRCMRCRLVLKCQRGFFPPYRLVVYDGLSLWRIEDASSEDVRRHLCENKVVIQ